MESKIIKSFGKNYQTIERVDWKSRGGRVMTTFFVLKGQKRQEITNKQLIKQLISHG